MNIMVKNILHIQNLKCEGCVQSIKSTLSSIPGISKLKIDLEKEQIDFESLSEEDVLLAIDKLKKMGYPLYSSENSFLKKSKSYISCAIGRMQKD